jgi:hypothetical protein
MGGNCLGFASFTIGTASQYCTTALALVNGVIVDWRGVSSVGGTWCRAPMGICTALD